MEAVDNAGVAIGHRLYAQCNQFSRPYFNTTEQHREKITQINKSHKAMIVGKVQQRTFAVKK